MLPGVSDFSRSTDGLIICDFLGTAIAASDWPISTIPLHIYQHAGAWLGHGWGKPPSIFT